MGGLQRQLWGELLRALVEPAFIEHVTTFLTAHKHHFPISGDKSTGFTIEAMLVYKEYQAMYERQMEAHLAQLGLTLNDFVAHVDQVLSSECLEVLLMLDDFEHFGALMKRVSSGWPHDAVRAAALPITKIFLTRSSNEFFITLTFF